MIIQTFINWEGYGGEMFMIDWLTEVLMFTNGKLDYFAAEESYYRWLAGWVATATILPVLAVITRMGKLRLENIYIIMYYNITYLLHTYCAAHIYIKLIKNSS